MSATMHRIATDRDGVNIDVLAILFTQHWLVVLAAPQVYRMLQRMAEPAHLVCLLDVWIAYTERGDNYLSAIPLQHKGAERAELARALRALIASWTPPELPAEIREAARAVLDAEGVLPLHAKTVDWNTYQWDLSDGRTVETDLSWSETEIMLKEATDAEREARTLERRKQIGVWLEACERPRDPEAGQGEH